VARHAGRSAVFLMPSAIRITAAPLSRSAGTCSET